MGSRHKQEMPDQGLQKTIQFIYGALTKRNETAVSNEYKHLQYNYYAIVAYNAHSYSRILNSI